MTENFNIPDNLQIDDDLYQPEIKSMPIITWHGKANESNSDTGGRWVIKVDALDEHLPGPEGWWESTQIKFGDDPSAEKEDVWITRRLRCVPIGIRRRQVIKSADGKKYYFPWMTKKVDRLDEWGERIVQASQGGYKAHYQVMVMIEGVPEPIVIALLGYTKTLCWDNIPDGKYGRDDFPRGVEPVLTKLAADASKQKKTRIPWLCFWVIDLVTSFSNGKPLWINVGSGEDSVYVNPFMADMRVRDDLPEKSKSRDGFPVSRFVGTENFIRYQNLRREVAMDWEAQWADASALAAASDSAYDYEDTSNNEVEEDDEIPF